MDLADEPVLRYGSLEKISNTDVVSFTRKYQGEEWLVLVNVKGVTSEFNLPASYSDKSYVDMITGEEFRFTSFHLNPYSFCILKVL